MNAVANHFGDRLRWWRERRGLSQLDLAVEADTSQRHLSFLESGRNGPSREMVLRLCAALNVPLRQQNALLLAAGYAPAWRESDLSAPELAKINSALAHVLAQQEPFPAVVIDRRWTVLRANRATARMIEFLAGAAPSGAVNLAEATISPEGLRPFIVNWEEAALYLLRGIQADALTDGTAETTALLRRLVSYPGVPALSQVMPPSEPQAPVLTLHFRKDDTDLRLFTTLATLGTPHDVTLQEIRIECFFPADEETAGLFRGWAAASGD